MNISPTRNAAPHKHLITTSRNGVAIYVDLINSEAALQISEQPHLLTLIKELLTPMKLKGATVDIERDMGRIIGITDVVKTTEADTVVYAKLRKSDSYVRLVKHRQSISTSYISAVLTYTEDGTYELTKAQIGRLAPALPNDTNRSSSEAYWSNHAYVWGSLIIRGDSLTKDCPASYALSSTKVRA